MVSTSKPFAMSKSPHNPDAESMLQGTMVACSRVLPYRNSKPLSTVRPGSLGRTGPPPFQEPMWRRAREWPRKDSKSEGFRHKRSSARFGDVWGLGSNMLQSQMQVRGFGSGLGKLFRQVIPPSPHPREPDLRQGVPGRHRV